MILNSNLTYHAQPYLKDFKIVGKKIDFKDIYHDRVKGLKIKICMIQGKFCISLDKLSFYLKRFLRSVYFQSKKYLIKQVDFFDSKTNYKFRKYIVLDVRHPGLGDSLLFSTLPEEFWKQFGKLTKIRSQVQFRNPEIYKLVWKDNPYVRGLTQKWPNAGYKYYDEIPNLINQSSAIANVELINALKPKNHFPKIYYNPKKIDELHNAVLIDLSSVTMIVGQVNTKDKKTYDYQLLKQNVLKLLLNFELENLYAVSFKNLISNEKKQAITNIQDLIGTKIKAISVENLHQYCDFIYSAKSFICLYSGQSALASAIKQQGSEVEVYCFIPRYAYELESKRSGYLFANIKFIVL